MIRASLQTRLDLVALLADADARGRISDDTDDNLERVDLFQSYGAKVRIVHVETGYQELLLRNQQRRESVPKEVLDRLVRKLDVPSIVEADVVDVMVD